MSSQLFLIWVMCILVLSVVEYRQGFFMNKKESWEFRANWTYPLRPRGHLYPFDYAGELRFLRDNGDEPLLYAFVERLQRPSLSLSAFVSQLWCQISHFLNRRRGMNYSRPNLVYMHVWLQWFVVNLIRRQTKSTVREADLTYWYQFGFISCNCS